jgi:hypothetical protein
MKVTLQIEVNDIFSAKHIIALAHMADEYTNPLENFSTDGAIALRHLFSYLTDKIDMVPGPTIDPDDDNQELIDACRCIEHTIKIIRHRVAGIESN